ncbi:MAG TPA: 30S ribosomal protein S13 [Oligoflexia bacterium]|nr:30S ribosomal protein S13 [Oligoflexia bacterium]HMP26476.1 30S ribosomal protein S13 [Oligoflexia bacterium]
MARIAGVDLPKNKKIWMALTSIYGIGRTASKLTVNRANVDPEVRVSQLSEDQISAIRQIIERDFKVEGDLKRQNTLNIKRLMDLGTYRGLRHRKSLPVRGQRTRTNSRTRKGPRKAPVVGKKMAPKK